MTSNRPWGVPLWRGGQQQRHLEHHAAALQRPGGVVTRPRAGVFRLRLQPAPLHQQAGGAAADRP